MFRIYSPGLPYPPFKDARVELKRQFLDEQLRSSPGTASMTGQKWYQLEAFRATNQAVGRVIRHSRDHGAVIFLDTRFGDMTARTCLSRWLQPHFTKFTNFGQATKSLAAFFKVDSSVGQMRMLAVKHQTELMNKSKPTVAAGTKRNKSSSDEEKESPPTENLHDLYNSQGINANESFASSIFATSSTGISFASSSSSSNLKQNRPAFKDGSQPKRKKIKITLNTMDEDQSDPKKESKDINKESQGAKDVARSWIKRFQKIHGPDKTNKVFKDCIRQYKSSDEFSSLLPLLQCVIEKLDDDEDLLRDFQSFVTTKHLSDFQTFLNVTVPQLISVSNNPA